MHNLASVVKFSPLLYKSPLFEVAVEPQNMMYRLHRSTSCQLNLARRLLNNLSSFILCKGFHLLIQSLDPILFIQCLLNRCWDSHQINSGNKTLMLMAKVFRRDKLINRVFGTRPFSFSQNFRCLVLSMGRVLSPIVLIWLWHALFFKLVLRG